MFSIASSPQTSIALRLYSFAASIAVEKLPSCSVLPFTGIREFQNRPLGVRQTPIYPVTGHLLALPLLASAIFFLVSSLFLLPFPASANFFLFSSLSGFPFLASPILFLCSSVRFFPLKDSLIFCRVSSLGSFFPPLPPLLRFTRVPVF